MLGGWRRRERVKKEGWKRLERERAAKGEEREGVIEKEREREREIKAESRVERKERKGG